MNRALTLVNKFILILILCIMGVFISGAGKIDKHENQKIHKNIYIENLYVGKLNKAQAQEKVNEYFELKTIHIRYNEKMWEIKPEDIDLEYLCRESVEEAYKYTRTDSVNTNIKRIIKLQTNETYNIKLKATYNEAKLSSLIADISKEVNIKEKEATIHIKDNSQMIREGSKEGREVDVVKLKEEIYSIIDDKKVTEVELPIKIIKPSISTEDIESIDCILGQYSTSFNDYTSRGSNIHVAGESTSDILIMPGEVFSYNETTGVRNWVNGYKTAKVIVGGKVVDGEGGGVCQVSTTIYNAVLMSGLNIIEVYNHTYPSSYAPRGRDAAVVYGYRDFKFMNTFSHPIYIKNIVKNGAVTSKVYGCSQDRQNLYIKLDEEYSTDEIKVKTYRIYLDEENNKIREELILESKYKKK